MKKFHARIIVLSVVAVALTVVLIFSNQSSNTLKTKEITLETVLKEMPYISISTEEISFMESLKENDSVKAAIKNEQITVLSIKEGSELAQGKLPSNIKVSEFSVINKAVCFGYFIEDYRVILEIFADNKIHKTIGVYSGDGYVKTIFENYNNETYQKNLF